MMHFPVIFSITPQTFSIPLLNFFYNTLREHKYWNPPIINFVGDLVDQNCTASWLSYPDFKGPLGISFTNSHSVDQLNVKSHLDIFCQLEISETSVSLPQVQSTWRSTAKQSIMHCWISIRLQNSNKSSANIRLFNFKLLQLHLGWYLNLSMRPSNLTPYPT